MSKVWLVSDLHLGHKNICKYRPEFRFPEEHNHTIAENLFQPLSKRDTIYLLGDICFSKDWAWIYKKLVDEVASVHLVIGNHDSENAERQSILKEAINAGVKMHSLVSYKGCWLSHAPLHPDELRGKYCIHGHMHRQLLPDTRYANVCVEHTNWAPILFTDVKARLDRGNSFRPPWGMASVPEGATHWDSKHSRFVNKHWFWNDCGVACPHKEYFEVSDSRYIKVALS